MNLFITYLWRDPRLFFTVGIIVVFSICVHEFMHAFAALKAGDDTAAERGHLTLNPFKQMGLFSLLLFCLFGLAWGRVPVDPAKMRGRFAPALVAFAGPFANMMLSLFFVILTYISAFTISGKGHGVYIKVNDIVAIIGVESNVND